MNRRDIFPGMRVRIREWNDMAAEFGVHGSYIDVPNAFLLEMRHLCGQVFTVSDVLPGSVCFEERDRLLNGRGSYYAISPEMLEFFDDGIPEMPTSDLYGILGC